MCLTYVFLLLNPIIAYFTITDPPDKKEILQVYS